MTTAHGRPHRHKLALLTPVEMAQADRPAMVPAILNQLHKGGGEAVALALPPSESGQRR